MNTKQSQYEIIVDFMTEHPQLSKGYIKAADAKQATNAGCGWLEKGK